MKYICHVCSKTISEKKAIEVELGGIASHKIHFCSEKCKEKSKDKKEFWDGIGYMLIGIMVILFILMILSS